MIESSYWKEDLLRHAKALKPVKKPPRWSEKLVVNFEKNLIISFFMIRKLIEANKISRKSQNHKMEVFCYPVNGKKITKLNHWLLDENYNMEKELCVRKSIKFIANQLIHSCTVFAYRKSKINRNWDGVYACSDFERDKTIYRIPIKEIIKTFELVGNDYPHILSYCWNSKKDDFDIETN